MATAIEMADRITDRDPIDVARLAVAIDGEGSISIGSAGTKLRNGMPRARQLRVVVTNTDIRFLDFCKRIAGVGSVHVRHAGKITPGGNKPTYQWVTSHRCAEAVLIACLPHFIIKREQAEIALVYQTTFQSKGRAKRIVAATEFAPLREHCVGVLDDLHARKRNKENSNGR